MGERHADLKRIVIAFTTLAAAHAAFVACGSTNESKRGREDGAAGEGGALEGGAPASGGSTVTAGRGGDSSQGGVAGSNGGSPNGGSPSNAGAPVDGGATSGAGSPNDGGSAGRPSDGGASAGGDVGFDGGAAGASGSGGEAGAGGDGNQTACITGGSRITIAFAAANALLAVHRTGDVFEFVELHFSFLESAPAVGCGRRDSDFGSMRFLVIAERRISNFER